MDSSQTATMAGNTDTKRRLRLLRAAEGYETATSFAQALKVTIPRYLNIEGGLPLSIDVAQRIVDLVEGCSLDWLYNGVERGLTVDLRQRLEAAARAPKQRPQASQPRETPSAAPSPHQGPKARPR